MKESYSAKSDLLKNRSTKLFVLVSVLAIALAVVLSGCAANAGKAVSGTWNLESMSVGGQSIAMTSLGISIEAKEDGTAVLTNKSTNATVNYTWEADKSKSSSSDTIYVIFKAGDNSYETTIRPSESTMKMLLAGGVENTYRKAS